MKRLLVIVIALLASSLPTAGQAHTAMGMRPMGRAGSPRVMSPGFRIRFRANPGFAGRFHRGAFLDSFFLNSPFFDPAFDTPEEGIADAPPPQVVVVPMPQAGTARAEPTPASPLLIEWQGDRFVSFRGASEDRDRGDRGPSSAAATPEFNLRPQGSSVRQSDAAAPDLKPAVLVFRDGRHEETANYAIINGILYECSDPWTGGSWVKKIQISELDLPATFRSNDERGVKFALPSGPNQIVTRP